MITNQFNAAPQIKMNHNRRQTEYNLQKTPTLHKQSKTEHITDDYIYNFKQNRRATYTQSTDPKSNSYDEGYTKVKLRPQQKKLKFLHIQHEKRSSLDSFNNLFLKRDKNKEIYNQIKTQFEHRLFQQSQLQLQDLRKSEEIIHLNNLRNTNLMRRKSSEYNKFTNQENIKKKDYLELSKGPITTQQLTEIRRTTDVGLRDNDNDKVKAKVKTPDKTSNKVKVKVSRPSQLQVLTDITNENKPNKLQLKIDKLNKLNEHTQLKYQRIQNKGLQNQVTVFFQQINCLNQDFSPWNMEQ